MALQPFVGPWPLLQFRNRLYTNGRTPWTGDQPVVRLLTAHRIAQTQNKHTHTSMPRVRFEPTIPVFERAKTVQALDRAATVIGQISVRETALSGPLSWSQSHCRTYCHLRICKYFRILQLHFMSDTEKREQSSRIAWEALCIWALSRSPFVTDHLLAVISL
jgi:hypothetical protein